MKLSKVYPGSLEVGMLVVGRYDPDAPTNPVQEMAFGLRVAELMHFTDPGDGSGRARAVAPVWEGGLHGGIVEYSSGVKYLVIEEG